VVHAIPVAAALRRSFPDARIDWVVSASHRELLDLVPVLDRRIAVDGLVHAFREVRRARYDVALDLQGLLKSAVLARSSGAGRVLGFARSYLRERLAGSFYTEVYDPRCGGIYDPRPNRHVIHINLGLLEPLGVPVGSPEFPIAPVRSDLARALNERSGGRYALLNPGAAWPNKRWPPSRLGQVAAALRDRYGLASIGLWGDEEERQLADEMAAHSRGAAIVPPRASIADLVALARDAALVVSGDTGPMHIAAAVGTPVVALFGPTRPARNGPWRPEDVVISRVERCQCHLLRQCRVATMCLLDIQVDEVLEAIARRLGGSSLASHA
jgi:heptosyltransferase I